jgi:hypothetical protein
MAKEKTEAVLLIQRSELEAKFNDVKQQVLAVAERCEKIEITDDESYQVGLNVAIEANTIEKKIDDKRSAVKKPYFETGKMIDAIAKELTEPLQKSIKSAKVKLKAFQDAEAKRKQEELEALQEKREEILATADTEVRHISKLKNFFENTYKEFIAEITKQKDKNKLTANVKALLDGFIPKTELGDWLEDAILFRDNIVICTKLKKQLIIEGDAKVKAELDKNLIAFAKFKKRIIDSITEEENSTKNEAIGANIATVSKMVELSSEETDNQRKIWKFDVVDIANVPRKYLVLDPVLVNKFIKEADKEVLAKSPNIISGLKIYQDTTVVLR